MFQTKICGVTNVADALHAADSGADAIGLNFYDKSSRYVSIDEARKIVWNSRPQIGILAGVFVNSPPSQIQEIVTQLGLTTVQLHGDESPEAVVRVAEVKLPPDFCRAPSIILARRMGTNGVTEIAYSLNACDVAGARFDAVLIDAATPGRYGGTGETVSWIGLTDHAHWLSQRPLILAGGLTPDNVADAIRIVRPHAVDVASGVESTPGKKDPAKVRDFIAAAREAFAQY